MLHRELAATAATTTLDIHLQTDQQLRVNRDRASAICLGSSVPWFPQHAQ
jgi:hypothetical protein